MCATSRMSFSRELLERRGDGDGDDVISTIIFEFGSTVLMLSRLVCGDVVTGCVLMKIVGLRFGTCEVF